MSLENILAGVSNNNKKIGLSEERLRAQMDNLRNLISFYREYPDIFVDHIKGENSKFKFYYYQRIMLRVAMRHRYVYFTFTRGTGKSFNAMMVHIIKAVLFPGSKLFITTGGKEQAASITTQKIEEICKLIPAFNNEIDWSRGQSKKSRDTVVYKFKNGSVIDILAARESSRGQRRTGGIMEECILIDQTALNEVIIPTMTVDRLLPDGTKDPKEVVNKSQCYITSAGWKNSFSYEKLIELLIQSLIEPEEAMIIGGSYEMPIAEGMLSEDFVEQLKLTGSYAEESFDREFRSRWGGGIEDAFYSAEKFDKQRVLLQAEDEYDGRTSKNGYYIIGVDVGRFDCTTEITIFKVTPQQQGSAIKSLVNLFSYDAEHFEAQAIHLKKLFFKYNARAMAVDGNGLGAGLVDFLVVQQIDPETNDILPPFGVINDEDGKYKKLKTPETINNCLYIIKANAPINTEAYTYAQSQMSSGRVKFLVDESTAKNKLMSTKVGQTMTTNQRGDYLRPYILTTSLKHEMLNLVQSNEGMNIILKQSSRGIKKDKFSSFIYGLYYIKQEEERLKKRKGKNITDFMFFT